MLPTDLMIAVAQVLSARQARYFVSGSLASMQYGEIRNTQDVDIVVDLSGGDAAALLERFKEPQYYLSREAVLEVLERSGQFNIIDTSTNFKADVIVAKESRYNESRFIRARTFQVRPGTSVVFSAPEDVILKKLEFYREGASDKHLRDIASMIKVSGDTFDRAYLDAWALELNVHDLWNEVKSRLAW